MATQFIYSEAADFTPSGINPVQFERAIIAHSGIAQAPTHICHIGDVVEVNFTTDLSAAQSGFLNSIVSGHVAIADEDYRYTLPDDLKYEVNQYDIFNKLLSQEWYKTDDGDGTYSDKVKETTYTYTGNTLDSRSVLTFATNGDNLTSGIYIAYQNGTNLIWKKG